MLTAHHYADGGVTHSVDPASLTERNASGFTWVDIFDGDEADFRHVREAYGLTVLALEEAERRAPRPTLQRHHGFIYLVAFSSTLAEIDLFVGPTWLVSVRRHDETNAEWDPTQAQARFERVALETPAVGLFLATILDELVDGYFEATDAVEDRLESLEELVFTEELGQEHEIQRRLFDIRRDLLLFRRAIVPLRDVMGTLLRREVDWITGDALYQLQDTHDHLLRVIDLVDTERELMGNAMEAHLAIISNRMNDVMKQLTAWGSIVFGATLIAGIYGMNFKHMPELDWWFGYPMALGMMAALGAALYRVFRRWNWL